MHMASTRNVLAAVVLSVAMLAMTAGSAAAATSFTHKMTGAWEVPGPGDPDGHGRFTVTVWPRRHTLCYSLHWEGIKSPMMAHVHKGRVGVAGPIKVTLFSSARPLPSEIDTVKGCVHDLGKRLLLRIKHHPARYYVNVHNRPFPNGALRGQLT
jgi:CHRD domain-containing protein